MLRLKAADAVVLFNGQGGEYAARFEAITKQATQITTLAYDPISRESPLHTCLLQGILKRDAMINALQRATELGVSKIIPIQTQHFSEKRVATGRTLGGLASRHRAIERTMWPDATSRNGAINPLHRGGCQ